ncbi:MAG: D-TA family PLP-dependent enzyme [Verrucomicrobiaceae bacterium]|nr:MAG: D-TA family PLP-dependent enzyme [Verrucomicrobiaceae bacterium]
MKYPLPVLENEDEVPSPALLIHWERVEENLRRMIVMAGGPERLRPHVKTHKLPQIVAWQVSQGVTKCKCATIAEAEMAAEAGARDVLLAAPLAGPNIARFLSLQAGFPEVAFSALVDDVDALEALNAAAVAVGRTAEVLVDLDIGQRRTGIAPEKAAELYRRMAALPGIRPGGLHAYDGHLTLRDLPERTAACDAAFLQVETLREELLAAGLPVPRVVAGGTPTFPIHARRQGVECSPGTCVLWDAGYDTNLPDLDFLPAAVLLTRVISRPGSGRICLDLGHKAVASEMPHPRVIFPTLPDACAVMHSEEHLVLETERTADFPVGTALYGIPWHICPTVALHSAIFLVKNDRTVDEWQVKARARRLTY